MLKVVWPDNQPPTSSAATDSLQPAHKSKDHILLDILLHTLLDQPVSNNRWPAQDTARFACCRSDAGHATQ